MGLAASQARLLTITSRKADCEFQSMQLSHEKIALSRDMEKISDEYQAAMNKTKLVYDYYGSGTSQMALNYGLLMTPSGYNDYYPRILTDNKNRAVLSAPYAQAATEAGIPKEGYNGTPSSEVRNKFIEALRDSGVISASTAADIESVSYNNGIGIGSTFSATAATQDITYDELLEMIKGHCSDTKDYGLQLGGLLPAKTGSNPSANNALSYPNQNLITNAGDGGQPLLRLYNDSGRITTGSPFWKYYLEKKGEDNGNMAVSLYDLLNSLSNPDGHYVIDIKTGNGCSKAFTEMAYMQQLIVGTENSTSFLNWMVDQFSSILGGVTQNDLALQYAYNEVYDLIYPNENMQKWAQNVINNNWGYLDSSDRKHHGGDKEDDYNTGEDLHGRGSHPMRADMDQISTEVDSSHGKNNNINAIIKASGYIGMVDTRTGDACKDGQYEGVAMDLTNIVHVFLTAFKEYLVGVDQSSYSYNKGKLADASLYDPINGDLFQILAPTDVTDGTENLVAGFYDALFNRICIGGWTENDNITDAEYMQELLKNGSVYISSIDNDGSYYQSNYATDTYISEVPDTEGIAKAEAKYNSQKAKLENKENTIDMKMKNLDTEISSLTTEYDTMKNVISKTIEKSFKRYEA